MKRFYYSDGYETFGPFSVQELKEKNLDPHSFVWFEGLAEWKAAETLPELDEIFASDKVQDEIVENELPVIIEEIPQIASPPSIKTTLQPKRSKTPLYLVLFLIFVGVVAAGLYFSGVVSFSKTERTSNQINQTLEPPEVDSFESQTVDLGPMIDYTGDPTKDVLLFVRQQDVFSTIAMDVARNGVIKDDDIKVLEEAYRNVMKVYSLYPAKSAGRKKLEELLAGEYIEISSTAEYNFLKAEEALSSCKNHKAFEKIRSR